MQYNNIIMYKYIAEKKNLIKIILSLVNGNHGNDPYKRTDTMRAWYNIIDKIRGVLKSLLILKRHEIDDGYYLFNILLKFNTYLLETPPLLYIISDIQLQEK